MTADKAARLAAIRAANRARAGDNPSGATTSETITRSEGAPSGPASSQPAANLLASGYTVMNRGLLVLLVLLFGVVSGLLILAMIEIWSPILSIAMPELESSRYLSLSRASAMVGYVLLWGSMAFGLSITSRMVRVWPGGPVSIDLHQYLSLLGLLFAIFHVVILLGDPLLGYTLGKALVPFVASSYRPMWVGNLGKSALYLMAIVWLSFYVRSRIGTRWWRRIHYLSFAVFLLTLVHGLFAGTDTPMTWARALYVVTGSSLLGLAIYRALRNRRTYTSEVARLKLGALTLDPITRIVVLADGRQVSLRTLEARLLYFLMQNAGQIVTAEQALAEVWGRSYAGEPHLVESYVRRLRGKIEQDPSNPIYIVSLRDQGYRFNDRPARESRRIEEQSAFATQQLA